MLVVLGKVGDGRAKDRICGQRWIVEAMEALEYLGIEVLRVNWEEIKGRFYLFFVAFALPEPVIFVTQCVADQ